MAYRIQYQSGIGKISRMATGLPARAPVSAALLGLIILVRLCSASGTRFLVQYLDHGPESVWERSVAAMSDVLAAGEGWYHALAVWCAAMLFGH